MRVKAVQLHDSARGRMAMVMQSRHQPDGAFAAHGRRFDRAAGIHYGQQRDYSRFREVNPLHGIAHLLQQGSGLKVTIPQLRQKQREVRHAKSTRAGGLRALPTAFAATSCRGAAIDNSMHQ